MARGRMVELADAWIELVARDVDSDRHLTWFFGPTDADHADHADDTPALRIELGGTVAAPPATPPLWRDGPISTWIVDDRAHFGHAAGTSAVADRDTIAIGNAHGDEGWRVHRQLLFATLSWWFECHDAVLLHAAAIARDGRTIVVTGRTGRGKSTCVAAALAAGWSVQSDDLVVVRTTGDRVDAFGVPKRISLDPELGHRVDLPSELLPADPRMRRMLTVPLARGRHVVTALVAVDHHDGDGELTLLPHRDALGAAVSSWPEAARPDALRRRLPHLVALASVPAFRLAHAQDADVRLDRAAALLDEVWRRSGGVARPGWPDTGQ